MWGAALVAAGLAVLLANGRYYEPKGRLRGDPEYGRTTWKVQTAKSPSNEQGVRSLARRN
jgi:hypothetical protein